MRDWPIYEIYFSMMMTKKMLWLMPRWICLHYIWLFYVLLCTDGTGTFGRVVLCRHEGKPLALKILSMADVIRLKQVDHVRNEITVLKEVNHPFIVNMLWSGCDKARIYMLLEFVAGGELFSYLRAAGRFSSRTSCFYTAEIVCALEYLHSKHIVYRDLKPENLLLDEQGHLKITDFGFSKKLIDRTWTLCGTPEYLAPEIIQSKGHNKAVDWWALGILIYEMLSGFPPFFDDNPFGIYEKIISGRIEWPKHMDPIAKDLVKKLLITDRTKRLGNMRQGAEDVKRHRWFKLVDWIQVPHRALVPPICPKLKTSDDASCFDDYPEIDWRSQPPLSSDQLELFQEFQ
ncbi:cAMP-dependent protein kinase catalytic subunit PRKX isoform X2 [Copidosoma floridanum]|uniref:cAMP-dependent protein kinase catalytic subunit PRKX isoform X2 n=1 Tax=Copidosoma floridanum TaxID=29053 RepID=UPI000C6F4CFA|nr:cAMP-dependent protein kinase catalytic subunit PRKX isoform X2 [Copidosoma floridanum]